MVVLLVCVKRSGRVGGWLCGLCQKEPKHVEAFNKVGLRRCYICINKTGATGDNVDTAEESTIALRERTQVGQRKSS